MAVSLHEIEEMIHALEPKDQIRLLQYLVPRLAEAILSAAPTPPAPARGGSFDVSANAWPPSPTVNLSPG
jgi:hypothetical protein